MIFPTFALMKDRFYLNTLRMIYDIVTHLRQSIVRVNGFWSLGQMLIGIGARQPRKQLKHKICLPFLYFLIPRS